MKPIFLIFVIVVFLVPIGAYLDIMVFDYPGEFNRFLFYSVIEAGMFCIGLAAGYISRNDEIRRIRDGHTGLRASVCN